MICGYAGVSGAGQRKDCNRQEDQTMARQVYGCPQIVIEAFNGKSMEKPHIFGTFLEVTERGKNMLQERFGENGFVYRSFLRSDSFAKSFTRRRISRNRFSRGFS